MHLVERSSQDSWVIHPSSKSSTKLRLFCFHHSGTGASVFRDWSKCLPDSVVVCPIQLPGRETRLGEPLRTHLQGVSEEIAEAMRPYLDRPFAFFGHSLGAIICFEVARQLRRQNLPQPAHLFIASCCAPHRMTRSGILLHQADDAVILETVEHRYGNLPKNIKQNPMLVRYLLPILRADFELGETYHCEPGQPLDCPISVFGGTADQTVAPEELRAWGEQTQSTCTLKMFSGNHFFFVKEPSSLLEVILDELKHLHELDLDDERVAQPPSQRRALLTAIAHSSPWLMVLIVALVVGAIASLGMWLANTYSIEINSLGIPFHP